MRMKARFPVLLFGLLFMLACGKQDAPPGTPCAPPIPTPGSEFPVASSNRFTRLGHAYELGEGVPIDLHRALFYYGKAAAEKDAEGQYRLGCAYSSSRNKGLRTQAEVLFGMAASQGHVAAAYELGCIVQDDWGRPENEALCMEWYKKAAERGHDAACTKLGDLYRNGVGVLKDPGKAMEWYLRGVARGNGGAMNGLASMYQWNEVPTPTNATAGYDPLDEEGYWRYRAYLAGQCRNAYWLKDLDRNPKRLENFKERARRDLGPSAKLETNGDWRIHPVEKPGTPRYWALATSALLVEMNHGQHERLGTFPRDNERARCKIAWLMFDAWGIRCRNDLLNRLKKLENDDNRRQFDEIARALEAEGKGDKFAIQRLRRSGVPQYRIEIVQKVWAPWRAHSLLGFDYGRYVTLCRWGYLVGFLSEQEAWDRIMPVARKLRKTFDAWEDLGENYILGRRFLSASITPDIVDEYRQTLDLLRSNLNYPWRECAWEMNIPDEPIVR